MYRGVIRSRPGIDLDEGVHPPEPLSRGLHLRVSDHVHAVDVLPLEVRRLHNVPVDDPEVADAHGGQLDGDRAPEPSHSDKADMSILQFLLARDPNLLQDDLPRIVLQLVVGEPGYRVVWYAASPNILVVRAP